MKNFPVDFSDEEIKALLLDLNNQIEEKGAATEGIRNSLERKIHLCQNQLQINALINSNNHLLKQQATLLEQNETLRKMFEDNSKTSFRTAREAKIIIILTILTILATSALDWYHMREENHNQKVIINQIDEIIKSHN